LGSSLKNITILFLVGINKFEDSSISSLSYAVLDAKRTERLFKIYNLSDNYTSLFDDQATKKNIFNELNRAKNSFDEIFIYYSSHGLKINGKHCLYAYDTKNKSLDNSIILLDDLISASEGNRSKITIFLDACDMHTVNEKEYKNVIVYKPSPNESYEDTCIKKSLFFNRISNKIPLLSLNIKNDNREISRYTRQRIEIQKIHETNNLCFLYGNSGVGKSYFLRTIKQKEHETYYISVPNIKNIGLSLILTIICEEILNVTSHHKDLYHDVNPKRFIDFFFTDNPNILLIIDHFDHIDQATQKEIIYLLSLYPINIILSSQAQPDNNELLYSYKIPCLSRYDVEELINEIGHPGISNNGGILSSKNYIDFFECLYNQSTTVNKNTSQDEVNSNLIGALILCGGFIDKHKFVETFNISEIVIDKLIEQGLIIKHEGFYYLHDRIYEHRANIRSSSNKNLAYRYWECEIRNNNNNTKAVQSFLILINEFFTDYIQNDSLYKIIISSLKGKNNTYFLMLIFGYINNKDSSNDLRLLLSKSLLLIGKFNEAVELCGLDHNSTELSILHCEILWWKGSFRECINKSSELIKYHKIPSLYCSRGIGWFFLGEWSNSLKNLYIVTNNNKNTDNYTLYISYCVIGTIYGIRGTDLTLCVDNFIECLTYARRTGEATAIALSYGNIGEILWKSGFYPESILTLETASHLAYLTDNDTLYSEINRNLVHAYHQSKLYAKEKEKVKVLEEMLGQDVDNYVKMQIINTLITHLILIGDSRFKSFMPLAKKLTEGNHEYEIYTLSNISLSHLVEDNISDAVLTMENALDLCVKGKNWLAIKQCLGDWDDLIVNSKFTFPDSKTIFQKWHQILEKELLPNLHHLYRLFAYLE
jgi:hypothetical protein